MPSLGWPEMIIVFGVLLLLFGTKRLPELARSLGQSLKELHRGVKEDG